MSLFGTFADVSLPDVISLIGCGSGKFIIRQQPGDLVEEYELNMENGHISRMSFNGQEIHSSEQAHSFITELMRDNRGEFEFQRGPIIKGSLWIHITEALLHSVSVLDEMSGLKEHFPDPNTIFQENERGYGTLGPELCGFWKEIKPDFSEGCSAAELSERLGLFLDQIQLKLYKLQLAKVIVPKRAYYKTEPLPALQMKLLQKTMDAEMQTLVRSLEPIWKAPNEPLPDIKKKTVPLPHHVREPVLAQRKPEEIARPDFSGVKIYRPDSKTVGSFMSSIKKLMRVG